MELTIELRSKIEAVLDKIRPYLITDGGNIAIEEISEDMVLKVRLLGNCGSCPMSVMTMKAGVEEALTKEIPELKGVEAVNLTAV